MTNDGSSRPTGATGSMPAVGARAVARKPSARRAGPVILIMGLLLAVLIVLFVPMLSGGAHTASSTSVANSTSQTFTTFEAATAELSFVPAMPATLPEGTTVAAYRVVDGRMLEVEYRVGRASVLYRTAPGNDDLTGDATNYAYTVYETVEDVARSYAGASEAKLSLAFWAAGGNSFALVCADGVEADLLRGMAQSVR